MKKHFVIVASCFNVVFLCYCMEQTNEGTKDEGEEYAYEPTYITMRTNDEKNYLVDRDIIPPQFLQSLKMKENESGKPIITLENIASSSMLFFYDLLRIEWTLKKMSGTSYSRAEKIYEIINTHEDYENLKKMKLQTWLDLLNDCEYIGLDSSTLDLLTFACIQATQKELYALDKKQFDALPVSSTILEMLTNNIPADIALTMEDNKTLEQLPLVKFFVSHETGNYYTNQSNDSLNITETVIWKFQENQNKEAIDKRTNIKNIYMHGCEIQTHKFCKLFFNLVGLEIVDSQFISGIHIKMFNNLFRLKKLTLQNCNIDQLPEKLFTQNIALESVNLKCNKLTALAPKLFDSCQKLRTLMLKGNPWNKDFNASMMPKFVQKAIVEGGGLTSATVAANNQQKIE